MTLYNVGPYCASLYLFLEIRHTVKHVQFNLRATDTDNTQMEVVEVMSTSKAISKALPDEVLLIQEILTGFEDFFRNSEDLNIVPVTVPTTWCSPKLNALKDILLEFYTTNFQVIVFVEQRQVAACISKVLPAMPELNDKIRSAHLVGQGVNNEGVSKTTDTYHGDAIQAFRKGDVNVREWFFLKSPFSARY